MEKAQYVFRPVVSLYAIHCSVSSLHVKVATSAPLEGIRLQSLVYTCIQVKVTPLASQKRLLQAGPFSIFFTQMLLMVIDI